MENPGELREEDVRVDDRLDEREQSPADAQRERDVAAALEEALDDSSADQ